MCTDYFDEANAVVLYGLVVEGRPWWKEWRAAHWRLETPRTTRSATACLYCIVTQQRSPWKSQMSTTQITLPRMGHVKCKWARKGPTPNQPFRSFHGLGSKRRHNCRALFVGQETRQPPAQYCAELCEHDSLTTWQLVELYVLALWSARPNHGVVSSP